MSGTETIITIGTIIIYSIIIYKIGFYKGKTKQKSKEQSV